MFKKFIIAALCGAFFIVPAHAIDIKEGVQYEQRADKGTDFSEIREVFSFWCSHCYARRGEMAKLKDEFKDKAVFAYNPVGLIGGDAAVLSQKAYAAAEVLNVEDAFSNALFVSMHEKGIIPRNMDDFLNIFNQIGVDKKTAQNALDSFIVPSKVAQYDDIVNKMNIDAVPEIVVNGKYLLISENIDNDKQMAEVIDYLLKKDHLPAPKK